MARAYAQLEQKSADLATTFGREWATKLFGEEAIASLPIRTVGKNKGTPKGFVIWRTARTAGWCRETSTPARVGQLIDAWIGASSLSPRGSVNGQWLGRNQALAASASARCFFEEGRARAAAERARWLAEAKELAD